MKVSEIIISSMTASLPQHEPDAGRVLTRALLAAAARLGVRNRVLAAVVGMSEASMSRLQHGRALDPQSKEGELALLFLRLYRSLDALVGGDDSKAQLWLHAGNDHLRGVPVERIRTVEGLVDVVQYLDAMRGRL
jgi:hypothetical protein